MKAIEAVVQDGTHWPSVMLVTWGIPESSWNPAKLLQVNRLLEIAATRGITVCCATGDGGVTYGASDGLVHVGFPASSPFVLACGGSRLVWEQRTIVDESAWDHTSGGISAVFPQPNWQGAANPPKPINPGGIIGRAVPDVAAHSTEWGYNVRVNDDERVIGGTSASAAVWAGLIARINQGLGRPIGYFNPALYTAIGPARIMRDITKGRTDVAASTGYMAGPGWDACTGWGSPHGENLLAALKVLNSLKLLDGRLLDRN
jgi:kumamolisin